jgi:hypothetical protein
MRASQRITRAPHPEIDEHTHLSNSPGLTTSVVNQAARVIQTQLRRGEPSITSCKQTSCNNLSKHNKIIQVLLDNHSNIKHNVPILPLRLMNGVWELGRLWGLSTGPLLAILRLDALIAFCPMPACVAVEVRRHGDFTGATCWRFKHAN